MPPHVALTIVDLAPVTGLVGASVYHQVQLHGATGCPVGVIVQASVRPFCGARSSDGGRSPRNAASVRLLDASGNLRSMTSTGGQDRGDDPDAAGINFLNSS